MLMLCVLVSLALANSPLGGAFQNILDTKIGTEIFHLKYSISTWVNDGLMTVFFLLAGLEIKRETTEGELSNFKSASLPVFAAIGGMLVPALIYLAFNHGTRYSGGWGIPMATDIAFSLAVISMLGSIVPASLRIFLTALAIVDDLGAIIVIAIFYTDTLHWDSLAWCAAVMAVLIILNILEVKHSIFYLVPGCLLWYFMHHSGIHATVAGVLLAFTIPSNLSETEFSPLEKLEHKLHIPVHFFIMPLFALANTNIMIHGELVHGLYSRFALGIIFGLVAGKVLGITLMSLISVKLGISGLPDNSTVKQMLGVGLLAGIGFTMSVFIALLSFKGMHDIQDEAKFAILVASVIAGVAGYLVLKANPDKASEP